MNDIMPNMCVVLPGDYCNKSCRGYVFLKTSFKKSYRS